MADGRSRIKRFVSYGLGSVVAATLASIFLMVLNGRQPDSFPLFFVTFLAVWVIAVVATLMVNRLRFKLWRRRGWTEVWVRSPEPLPGGLANSWVRGLISVRAPLVDFVTDESREGAWVKPATFLVNGRMSPDRRQMEVRDYVAINFGPGLRVVSLQTTYGPIDVAGYPEALDQFEADLFGSVNR
jgi:hypothetical protein